MIDELCFGSEEAWSLLVNNFGIGDGQKSDRIWNVCKTLQS